MLEAQWLLFLVASVVVIFTPGQDMILVMSRSLTHGTRAGLATAAGVSVGLVVHTLLATAGLGALLRTSEWLFTAIKLAGAAYLLYLGAQLLFTRTATISARASAARG
jgi:threonine/homoserine/homoserine lactone efflux protein